MSESECLRCSYEEDTQPASLNPKVYTSYKSYCILGYDSPQCRVRFYPMLTTVPNVE